MPKPPLWFTLVCVVAVLWNVAGLLAVVSDLQLSAADVAQLSTAEQAMYASRPLWSVFASVVAVVGGTVGSVSLLVRRRWSTIALLASVLGVVAQDVSLFLMTRGTQQTNPTAFSLQAVVLIIACGLLGLANHANSRQWLR
jgi:hypothetical protein